jgi:hypothetical protein
MTIDRKAGTPIYVVSRLVTLHSFLLKLVFRRVEKGMFFFMNVLWHSMKQKMLLWVSMIFLQKINSMGM